MFLALAQLTNKAFTDAGKGRIRQSLTALVSSASWWWKTAFVALACGVMQSYYWRNVVPAVGMLGFLGDIFNMAGQSWCILTGH